MAVSVVSMETSEPPTTAQTYENFQSASAEEEEEREKHFGKDFPLSKSFSRRVCPTSRLILVLMLFCGVLILSVSILGIQGIQFTTSLRDAQEGLKNISQTVEQGVAKLKDKRNNTGSRLAALEKTLQRDNDQLLKVIQLTRAQLESVEKNSRTVQCELAEMRNNGSNSGCCPRGWLTFRSSCYWVTQSRDSWEAARKVCEERKSHLVILNSPDEQDFVNKHRSSGSTWIGLTDVSGTWKWVDGSSYAVDPKDWEEGQPDHWYGHNLGGGEDCAHMRNSGRWNDNHCSRSFNYVCEMELGV